MVTAVLFDLDGVLVDTEPVYTRIWSDIDDKVPTGVENFAIKIKGTNLDYILNTYFPSPKAQQRVRCLLAESESKMEFPVYPGIYGLLDFLKRKGILTAIVTSSADDKMQYLEQGIPGFQALFNVVVTGSDVKHSKPHPEGYLLAAQRLGVDAADCVVVEDSINGLKAGRGSGAKVVGIANSLPHEAIAPYADVVLDNTAQLSSVIEKL